MKRLVASALLAILPCAALANGETALTPFSEGAPSMRIPAPWQPLRLPGEVRQANFSLTRDENRVVLRIEAQAAASSLMHPLQVDPLETPLLSWSWKISRTVSKGNIFSKANDDYPARLYVMFDMPLDRLPLMQRTRLRLARALYGDSVPVATLCYVWDHAAQPGTSVWSPYTDRVRMVVVRSGNGEAGRWLRETRDVVADFRAAFGEDPPRIKAVALAADTDNTGEHVVSYFGDLGFQTR